MHEAMRQISGGRKSAIFPKCVARVPVSFWGFLVVGVFARRCVCVRNRLQQPATIRNRSREVAMAVPTASSARVVTIAGFKRCIASFHVVCVALCDIPTCFITCRESVCVACAVLLPQFSWQALHRHSERRSTSDMACCLFFLRIALSGLRGVVTTCKFRGRHGIL